MRDRVRRRQRIRFLCRRVWVQCWLGPRLKLLINCCKSRNPKSGYNRTKYRMRGFHLDSSLLVTYGTQHTRTVGCLHPRDERNAGNS